MTHNWFILAFLCSALCACNGETKTQDSPETLRALDDCQQSRAEKDKYIKQLEERLADYKLKEANDEIMVTIEGNDITLRGKSGSPTSSGKAPKKEHITSFVKQVQAARGSMQRCYQNALKKDNNLQARPVTLNIQVRFTATGKVGKATFMPVISHSFTKCMSAVATKWRVPGAPSGVIFQQPISLTPQ